MDNFKRSIFARKAKTAFEKSLLKATYLGDFDVPKEKHIQKVIMGLQGQLQETNPDSALSLLIERLWDRNWPAVLKAEIITHRSLEHLGLGSNNKISELELPLGSFHDYTEKGKLHNKIIRNYFAVIQLLGASKRYNFLTLSTEEMTKKVDLLASEEMLTQAMHLLQVLEKIVETAPDFQKCVNTHCLKVTQSAAYWLLKESIRTYNTISLLLDRLVDRYYKLGLDLARNALKCYDVFEKNTYLLKRFFEFAQMLPYKDLTPPLFVNRPQEMVNAMNKYIEEASLTRSVSAKQLKKKKKPKKPIELESEEKTIENLQETHSPSNQENIVQVPMVNYQMMYNTAMNNPAMAQMMQNQMLQNHFMQNAYMANPMMQTQMMPNSMPMRQTYNPYMTGSVSYGTPQYNPFDDPNSNPFNL